MASNGSNGGWPDDARQGASATSSSDGSRGRSAGGWPGGGGGAAGPSTSTSSSPQPYSLALPPLSPSPATSTSQSAWSNRNGEGSSTGAAVRAAQAPVDSNHYYSAGGSGVGGGWGGGSSGGSSTRSSNSNNSGSSNPALGGADDPDELDPLHTNFTSSLAAALPSTPRPSNRTTLPLQPMPPPPTTPSSHTSGRSGSHPPSNHQQVAETPTSTREAWKKRKQTLLAEASSQSITTTNFHQHAHLKPPVFMPTTSWLGSSSAVARPEQSSAYSASNPNLGQSSTAMTSLNGASSGQVVSSETSPATLASSHSAVLNYDSPVIKEDIIRMMEQWLGDEGFNATKQALMEEAGLKARERDDASHDARKLKKALLEGDWPDVDKLINKPLVKNHKAFLYAVYKLQFLEHIEHREYQKAFTFLAKRLKPLEHYQPHKAEFRDLCYLLSAKSITDAPSFRAWEGIQPARENLVAQFSAMLEQDRMERESPIPGVGSHGDAYAYVPPRRLLTIIHQAVAYQVEFARYHPKRAPVVTSLLQDYAGFIVPNAVSATLRGHRRNVKSVRFVGEEGTKLVSGSSDTTVRLWDTASGACDAVLEGHTSRIWEVDSTRSGSMVASASGDGTVRIWNVHLRSALTTLQGGMVGDAYTCTFHSDERHLLAGGYDKLVRLFDINTGTVVKTFTGHQLGISSAVFSPVGNLIVTGSKDTMVRFWDVVSGLCIGTLHDHLGEVTSVAFNSSGTHLLTSSKDNSNRLWDMRMLRPLQRFKGHQNTAKNFVRASFAHTSLLVGGSEDGRIYMWDEESSEVLQTLAGHGQTAPPHASNVASGSALAGRRSRRGTVLGLGQGQGLPSLNHSSSGLGISTLTASSAAGASTTPSDYLSPAAMVSLPQAPAAALSSTATTSSNGLNVVYEATWNAAQSLLASCGEDGTVRTWIFDEQLEVDDADDWDLGSSSGGGGGGREVRADRKSPIDEDRRQDRERDRTLDAQPRQ